MTETAKPRFDILTVMGLAAVAYVVTTLLHEGLGHGGACVAVGGKPLTWGAYYFECDTKGLPATADRIVAAMGSTVNLVIAILTALVLKARLSRRTGAPHGAFTVFMWLMFALNGFTWAGYYLFSGVAGIGDWGTGDGAVLHGLSNQLLIRAAMFVFGGACYVLIGRSVGRMLGQILGGDDKRAGMRLAWTAYVTGAVVAVSIGFLNPLGWIIVLESAVASSMGGTSGFLWQHRFMQPEETPGLSLSRNWLWVVLGIIAATAYAVVFGPSVKFH